MERMKQRLRFKASAGDNFEAPPPLNEQPIGMESEPPAGDDVQQDNQDEGAAANKNQNKNFNRASPMKIVRLCKAMNPDQRALITSVDFGDFIGMKCSKLNPELCRFLMECFNPDTCELDFGVRGKIPITDESVFKVMGVPMGSTPVAYTLDVDATSLILAMLGIVNGQQPLISWIEEQLGPTFPADQAYLRKFIIYTMCSVFAPTTGTKISPRCYPCVINTAAIRNLNWARFIIEMIIQTARAKDKKNWFKCCMPYLMLLYVDSLETEVVHVPEDVTRCCIWTNKLVKLVVDLDTNNDGSFGRLPLKACFRDKISLFTSQPSHLDLFIKRYAPGNHNEEDLVKYREAITEMCSVFEDGLGKFIMSLSSGDVKGKTVGSGIQQANEQERKKGKRTATGVHETKKRKTSTNGVGAGGARKKVARDAVQMRDQGLEHDQTVEKTGSAHDETHHPATKEASVLPLVVSQQGAGSPSCMGAAIDPNVSNAKACKLPLAAPSPGQEGIDHKSAGKANKNVTFTDDVEDFLGLPHEEAQPDSTPCIAPDPSPLRKRPITRSMSPKKSLEGSIKDNIHQNQVSPVVTIKVSASPRRLTRSATAEARASRSSSKLQENTSANERGQFGEDGTSTLDNGMNTKLELDFDIAEAQTGTNEATTRQALIEDCPSFELGLDEPAAQPTKFDRETQGPESTVEEAVVISSNDESGDSYDKIYAMIDMPTTAAANENEHAVQEVAASPIAPKSFTPKPETRQKRLIKTGKDQKSPYMPCQNKIVASKFAHEVYNKVCAYGGDDEDELNKVKIIDYGKLYIYLWELADAVRPGAWLCNKTCGIALHVLSIEMAKHRKHVMPLHIASKLRSPMCVHDRSVKKAFSFSPENRLDHKDLINFSVLQNLTPNPRKPKEFTGHYYLIVLNLKAERFEIMDSLRAEGDLGLMEDARAIIGSIKHMWSVNYSESSIKIHNYPTVHIPTPMQKTTFDCGFFMLKYIEAWDGRRMSNLNPTDMKIVRKLFTKKWLEWTENKTDWLDLLF